MQGMFAPARLLMCGCKSQLQCHDIIEHDYTLLLTAAMLSCISRTFLSVCPCSLMSKALRHVQPHLYNVVAWLKMQIVLLPCPPPPPPPPPPSSPPPPPPPPLPPPPPPVYPPFSHSSPPCGSPPCGSLAHSCSDHVSQSCVSQIVAALRMSCCLREQ